MTAKRLEKGGKSLALRWQNAALPKRPELARQPADAILHHMCTCTATPWSHRNPLTKLDGTLWYPEMAMYFKTIM